MIGVIIYFTTVNTDVPVCRRVVFPSCTSMVRLSYVSTAIVTIGVAIVVKAVCRKHVVSANITDMNMVLTVYRFKTEACVRTLYYCKNLRNYRIFGNFPNADYFFLLLEHGSRKHS